MPKYAKNAFATGTLPRTLVGELTGLPITLAGFKDLFLRGGESIQKRGGEGKGRRQGKRKGKGNVEGKGHTGISFTPL